MHRGVERVLSEHPVLVWTAAIGSVVALDVWCSRNTIVGDSLSECVRTTLRTDTPTGQAAFIAGWSALSAWFIPHILKRVNERENDGS